MEGQRDEQECTVEKSQQVKEVPREGHFCMELGKVKGTEESTRSQDGRVLVSFPILTALSVGLRGRQQSLHFLHSL